MIQRLCLFTINYAYNRQIIVDYLEKILPKSVEIFLFVPKQCKGKYISKRTKITESSLTKYICFWELRKFCRKNKIDRLFALGALPQEGLLMILASILTPTDIICYLMSNPFDGFKYGFTKYTIKAFFEFLFLFPMIFFPKRFYVMAKDLTKIAQRFFFFQKRKIDLLIFRIDTKLFSHKNKSQMRKKLNLPKNKKITITVGRIEYAKGSDILIELAKRNPDILFLSIGQLGDKRFSGEGIKNLKIISPMNQKKLVEYYNAADIGLFPTRIDAGPLVARECFSCKTPVLISDINGPRNFIPSIKAKVNVEDFEEKLRNFFNLSNKEKKILSDESYKFILDEGGEKRYSSEYIKKLIEV